MSDPFFDKPILNSPYAQPLQHWELEAHGQPTQQIVERRRRAEFITPIPRPKKRRHAPEQQQFVLDAGDDNAARDELLVTGTAPGSEFLDDLRG